MKRLLLASCAALLVLAPVLALAQSRTPPAGATSSGTAVARGGETSSGNPGTSSSNSSGSSGGTAVSRGGDGYSGGSSGSSSMGTGPGGYQAPSAFRRAEEARRNAAATGSRARNVGAGADFGQAPPAALRPRGDTPVYGQAVPRGTVLPKRPVENPPYTGGYWEPYGSGYLRYDGSWFNPYGYYSWYYPYGYYRYGFGYSALPPPCSYYGSYAPCSYYGLYSWFSPWGAWGDMGWGDLAVGGGGVYERSDQGGIRFKVTPKTAEVWVDGYFEGTVDAFDGRFKGGLKLKPGNHKVELKASGFETLTVDVRVVPGRTITYTGELKALPK